MKRHTFVATVFAAVLLAGVLTSGNALAQAVVVKNSGEFNQSGWVNCPETGIINWSGVISWRVHTTTDENGGIHYHVTYDFNDVDGVDNQGKKYQGNGRQTNRFNNPVGDSYEQTATYRWSLVGSGGKGITCTGTYRLVVNANGEVTVTVNEPTVCECN